MFGIGVPELVIIVLFFFLFMFGSSRIGDFARTLGRFSGEFQKGRLEIERELKDARSAAEKGFATTEEDKSKKKVN